MKILLVGEYSGLHNSLKEGLAVLGHDVTLIATGDYFKNYPADIKLKRKYETGLGKKLKVFCYRFLGTDITSISLRKQIFSRSEQLKGFDIVQLINESSMGASPKLEKEIVSFLKKHNKKLFLLSCGTDHLSVKYQLGDALPHSILKGYKENTAPTADYEFALKYLEESFIDLHEHVYANIAGVIASDLDYHLPLKGHPKYLGLIPNPVNLDKLKSQESSIESPIRIFLGINRTNYHTKGISYFEEALDRVRKEFPDRVHIEVVENLPYAEYITKYSNAHIVLDQALAYDQGYNALEAMAQGKVVFTGAGEEFMTFYGLQKPVAINARPDADEIFENLKDLILNPEKIREISTEASAFIKREHNYLDVAKRYLSTWEGQ